MKNYANLKKLSNAVLVFANKDRLSRNESSAILDLLDMQKGIISESVLAPEINEVEKNELQKQM